MDFIIKDIQAKKIRLNGYWLGSKSILCLSVAWYADANIWPALAFSCSTPILNPPQSGVLGMHNIVDRATIVDGQIVARPIMYVALSYDHRIIDGKEAVSFLKCVKDYLEEPRRLFLDL